MTSDLFTKRIFRIIAFDALILTLFLVFSQMGVAQNRVTVSGTVSDESGNPLVGVTVFQKGTQNATATDLDGRFSVAVSSPDVSLCFAYMGFLEQEKKVSVNSPMNVIMVEDAQQLEEVQVIGYAVIKKSDLTGSVSSVKADVMEDRMVLSVEDALRGQLAGVSILSTDGAPGASMNIRIRGTNSINASNSPLYVVDGVLMENTDISPSEIESMEILKDASSTAIYGSRGANGVVIITTKKGRSGAPRINFSATVSMQQPVRQYEMMNAEEFARYCVWGTGRAGGDARDYYDSEGHVYNISYATTYADRYQSILDGSFTTDTDWQKEMLKNAFIQEYRLSIAGGDQKGSYSVMGSVLTQDGIVLNTGMDRYNVRANFDRLVLPWMRIGVNVSGSSQSMNNTTGNVIKTMLSRPPTKDVGGSEEIDITDDNTLINQDPVSQAYEVVNKQRRLNATFKGWTDIMFAKIFRLNISGSYSINDNKTERYYPSNIQAGNGSVVNGRAQTIIGQNVNWLNENLLYITPKFKGIHSFDALAGVTLQGNNIYNLNTEANNFPYEDKGVNNMGMGLTPIPTDNHYTKSTLLSFLARANYKLKDRYLFTASIRADGSSRLAENAKWGYFPSGAVAWRMSEEPFIKDLNLFSELKLRASAGVSGNTGIAPYQTLALMSTSGYPMDGVLPQLGLTANRTSNPDLRWETTTQYDAGIDIGMWNNRLSMTVDIYLKKTKDLLLLESVPEYTGYSTRWTNRGKVDNKGLEISISGYPVSTKDFTWSSAFNISFNRSKVRYIAESGWMVLSSSAGGASDFGFLKEGMPIGLWYGYADEGVYKSMSEIQNSQITSIFGSTTMRPGYIKYVDHNGDKEISDSDRQVIGMAEPKFIGGFINTFNYKNLELQVGLEFKYGGTVFNSTRMSLEGAKGSNTNQTKRAAKYGFYQTLFLKDSGKLYFQGNEDIAYIGTPLSFSEPQNYVCRSLYIEDASYLRINDITLSYTLPARLTQKMFIRNLKFFVSVKNAYVFTNYTGFDPDVNSVSSSGADLLPGLDDCAYPRTRNYSAGINLTF